MSLEFFDEIPPANLGGKAARWGTDIAPELRANPGRWALIVSTTDADMKGQMASWAGTIRLGNRDVWYPKGRFEAAVRTMPDGEYRLYARYLGDSGVAE